MEDTRRLQIAMVAVERWHWPAVISPADVARFADAFRREGVEKERLANCEKVASMMIEVSIATGHGDTIDDLLGELAAHIIRSSDRDR